MPVSLDDYWLPLVNHLGKLLSASAHMCGGEGNTLITEVGVNLVRIKSGHACWGVYPPQWRAQVSTQWPLLSGWLPVPR